MSLTLEMGATDIRLGELRVSPQTYAKMVLLNNSLSEDLAKCFGVNGGTHWDWLLYVYVSSHYPDGSALIGQPTSAADTTIMAALLAWGMVFQMVWRWLTL